jgi:hypothetical protein
MAKFKKLILAARQVYAKKKRSCHHNRSEHLLSKGDICLEVRDRLAWKGYCSSCALEMIAYTRTELNALETAIRGAICKER